jgi:hypothetical protein
MRMTSRSGSKVASYFRFYRAAHGDNRKSVAHFIEFEGFAGRSDGMHVISSTSVVSGVMRLPG